MTATNKGEELSGNEKFYDDVICPALTDLGKQCQERGMSFAAEVEWEPGKSGSTATLAKGNGVAMGIIVAAMQAHGNVDSLILAIMKYAREHGHSSICLSNLGVPLTPGLATPAEVQP